MSDIVIKAENLGKMYTIGHQSENGRYVALRDVLMQNARTLWSKTKDLAKGKPIIQGDTTEEVWALKDVSFEIRRGEAVGIIGRNGAGKSTLLKVLSRITEPSSGRVTIKGRVASLLEVGTGFHPELTGRENIFLNGTILGMTRKEIKRKFDEIVSFAEVEKYLDTPVKRYSSGMYVRLAFAVAAHLEPEILVVDEVLAVGDVQFQKKCLGKMQDVSTKEGRTVLFVSHNMGAISQLCNSCILLNNGQLAFRGDVHKATQLYLRSGRGTGGIDSRNFIGTLKSKLEFLKVNINGSPFEAGEISPSSDITITVEGRCLEQIQKFRTSIVIYREGVRVCTLHDKKIPEPLHQGLFVAEVRIPAFSLRPGEYLIAIGGHDGGTLSAGTEWIFGNEVSSFIIHEEWSDRNDFADVGVVNLPYAGYRKYVTEKP